MSVICYGDSNTYGYDPRSFFGSRYPADVRWVDLLSAKLGCLVCNEGGNGREIPRETVKFPEDTQLLMIMLGTNDLLHGRTAAATAERMERLIKSLTIPMERVLLIAPPPMARGEWVTDGELIKASCALAEKYRLLAECLGIHFVDAGEWHIPMCYDGVHFTEEGHRRFAEGLYMYLKKEDGSCLKLE